MTKTELLTLIEQNKSIREIASFKGIGPSTVRYYLKKYSLKTNFNPHNKGGVGNSPGIGRCHLCSKCGTTNPEDFYGNKKKVCGKCHNKYTTDIGRKRKKYCVEKLGNKCSKCGYNKCIEALDLHHIDSSLKSKNFRSKRGWSFKRLDEELKNCKLLCANCHREEHYYNGV